jgi:hypothetical protein
MTQAGDSIVSARQINIEVAITAHVDFAAVPAYYSAIKIFYPGSIDDGEVHPLDPANAGRVFLRNSVFKAIVAIIAHV